MEKEDRTFVPANTKQRDFMNSMKTYLMLSGAVAAGKSFLGCHKGFMLNMLYPGNRGLICRKEASSLRNSTMKTLFDSVIPPSLIVSFNQMTGVLVHRTPILGVNSEIIFSGLDKGSDQQYPTKIGSTEYGWIFLDEGVETEEGDWQMLSTRLRYKIPRLSDEQNGLIPRQIFTATNPDAPEHYLHKFFFLNDHKDREVFLTTPYDNPFLPPEYIEKLEATLTGINRERLLHGKWVQAEGIIYQNFDPRIHCDKSKFLDLKDYKQLIIGADSNYPLPRAAVLIGIREDQRIDVLDEFYQEYAHIETLCDWIKGIYDQVSNTIYLYHDPSDPEAINKINSVAGVFADKAYNKVIPGISAVARYFDKDMLRMNPACVNLIRELQSYRWKPNKDKEEPEKKNDHAVDALRYAIATYRQGQGEVSVFYDDSGVIF